MFILFYEYRNGWYFIDTPNGGFERYLYYTKHEAFKRHREKYGLKGKHIKFIER